MRLTFEYRRRFHGTTLTFFDFWDITSNKGIELLTIRHEGCSPKGLLYFNKATDPWEEAPYTILHICGFEKKWSNV